MLKKIIIFSMLSIIPTLSLTAKTKPIEKCPDTLLSTQYTTHLPLGHETIQFKMTPDSCHDFEPSYVTCQWGYHHCQQIKDLQYRVRILEDVIDNIAKRNY